MISIDKNGMISIEAENSILSTTAELMMTLAQAGVTLDEMSAYFNCTGLAVN